MSNRTTSTTGNLALALNPAPSLSIVEKPSKPVCPSALREPKAIFIGSAGRKLEAQEYSLEQRIFQDLATGQTYHLRVIAEQIGNMVMSVNLLNGRVVSAQEYVVVEPQFAGRSMRYVQDKEQAIRGGYDNMQTLILSGRV